MSLYTIYFLLGEIIDARMVMARIVWEGFTSLTSASWAPDYFYSILIRELSACICRVCEDEWADLSIYQELRKTTEEESRKGR